MTWTVPANTYPYGYNVDGNGVAGMGTMLTIAQCELKQTVYKLHPEFWRRYSALMQYALTCGVHLGVGTGWRIQQNPPPPGFAQPGNSNHEGFPADGTSGGAVAIDTVCDVSWNWMEHNLAAYGLKSFRNVNDEPWHIQPAEIPNSRNWRTEPWKLETFPLPGETPVPQPPEEDEVTDEDIDKIVKKVWSYMTTDPPSKNPVSTLQLLQYARHAAANADAQTKDL